MAAEYTILGTQPYTYQDRTRQIVNGYRVDFVITAYDETHYVLVPTLTKATVDQAISTVIADRKALGPASPK